MLLGASYKTVLRSEELDPRGPPVFKRSTAPGAHPDLTRVKLPVGPQGAFASWGSISVRHSTSPWPVCVAAVHHVHQEKGVLALKIGPFTITRVRKTSAGLVIYPWQALTEDRITPELRQIVAKMARSECKSYLQSLPEDKGRCTGPHICQFNREVYYCRESCAACMGANVRACFAVHDRSLGENV